MIIKFQRYQDVTGWPCWAIRDWCRRKGWVHGFRIDWQRSGDNRCIIERLPS